MTQSPNIQKLVNAYDRMVERVKADLEETDRADPEQPSNLQGAVQRAAYLAVELNELTDDEARLLGRYVQRDLEDAGAYLASSGDEDLGTWLRFDLDLIENRLLELFQSAADRTRLEMLDFQETLERVSHYHTGEITGPGTLRCDNCGKELNFHGAAHIPPCPGCRGTVFSRAGVEE